MVKWPSPRPSPSPHKLRLVVSHSTCLLSVLLLPRAQLQVSPRSCRNKLSPNFHHDHHLRLKINAGTTSNSAMTQPSGCEFDPSLQYIFHENI